MVVVPHHAANAGARTALDARGVVAGLAHAASMGGGQRLAPSADDGTAIRHLICDAPPAAPLLRQRGVLDYAAAFDEMRAFTAARTADTRDEIWLCQHPPVFTQGQAGRPEHVLGAADIPVVQTDRGGQITYHGPGQVVAYPLVDLRRRGYFVKELVRRIEDAVLQVLASHGLAGRRVPGAPGIYVPLAGGESPLPRADTATSPFAGLGKIAAIGLKVQRHCSYHGVALNVTMDLSPYARINPCGYAGLQAVDMASVGVQATCEDVASRLGQALAQQLVT